MDFYAKTSPSPFFFPPKTQCVSFFSNSAAPEGKNVGKSPTCPAATGCPSPGIYADEKHTVSLIPSHLHGVSSQPAVTVKVRKIQSDLPSLLFTLALSSGNETQVAGSRLLLRKGKAGPGISTCGKQMDIKDGYKGMGIKALQYDYRLDLGYYPE